MPKVTEKHKERRRAQILEGAQRAFARHGYEGTTVTILEEVTGLSRGAIFNYFPNKQAIFLELAIESNKRLTEIWLEQGFRESPEWTDHAKRALIERGWAAADAELRAYDASLLEQAS